MPKITNARQDAEDTIILEHKMNNKKIIILAIIAAVTATLAIWTSMTKQTPSADPTKPKYLIGNIEPTLINEIHIGTGKDMVTIKRSRKQFVVTNKDGYPAQISEINDLIRTCVDIQISELYTDDAGNHKALGVLKENPTSQVKFFKSDATLLTGLIIGDTKEGGLGTYIRQPDSDNVYLTLGNPRIRTGSLDYIEHEIIPTITKESIESVSVTQAGEKYTLSANDQGQIAPDKTLEGKILKDSEVEKVFTAISSLRLTDVSKDDQTLKFDKIYVCKTAGEIVYTLFLLEKDDKAYLTCSAAFNGQLPANSRNFATQDELKDKEAKYLARDNAVKFSAKHSGWVYEISNNSAKNLTKPLEDLFEDPPPPPAPEEPEADATESPEHLPLAP
jgi:hypothetical protein